MLTCDSAGRVSKSAWEGGVRRERRPSKSRPRRIRVSGADYDHSATNARVTSGITEEKVGAKNTPANLRPNVESDVPTNPAVLRTTPLETKNGSNNIVDVSTGYSSGYGIDHRPTTSASLQNLKTATCKGNSENGSVSTEIDKAEVETVTCQWYGCSRTFSNSGAVSSRELLLQHLHVDHCNRKPFDPTCRWESCSYSSGRNKLDHLKSHVRKHAIARNFLCEHCGRNFNRSQGYRSHVIKKVCQKEKA